MNIVIIPSLVSGIIRYLETEFSRIGLFAGLQSMVFLRLPRDMVVKIKKVMHLFSFLRQLRLAALCLLAIQVVVVQASAEQASDSPPGQVRVGGYEFEPFVEKGKGFTPAFLALLNEHQNRFHFEFVEIPAQRRYEVMERAAIDAIFFEMPRWGWREYGDLIEATAPLLADAEAFYALAGTETGAAIFERPENSMLALTLGYHYAFADFKSDQGYIRSRFNVVFGKDQGVTLKHLLTGSADLAVLSNMFVRHQFVKTPGLKKQILRAPKADQDYALPLLVRRGGPISSKQLTEILDQLTQCACLKRFFSDLGVGDLLAYKAAQE